MIIRYTRSITAVLITSLCVSLLPSAYAQAVGSQVSPFDFQLDESAVDGKRYSYVINGGSPAAIIKQNETKSLPIIILPATDKPIPIEFHLSVGYNQTGAIQMPLGVHAIVEPSEITVKPHQNETINIVVSVEKNAPSGKYQLNIVGEWPGPNGFLGSSIIINVGKDYGPDAMPFNAMWTPLKQYQSGVAIKDISCNQDLQLVIKTEDGSPACVKPQTAKKLVERGWGTFPDSTKQAIPILSHSINITNTGLIANYNITGGTVSTINQARPDLYDIELKPITNGSLSITLPEYLIKGKIYVMGNHDKLLNYSEVFDYNHEKRTITIYFNQDDKFIQLTSESEWRALTNPLPCKGGCVFP